MQGKRKNRQKQKVRVCCSLSFFHLGLISKDVDTLIENVASRFKLTLSTVCVQLQEVKNV